MNSTPQPEARAESVILSVCNFLSKGWEASMLSLLVFIQHQYQFPLYVVGILSGVFIVCQISISLFAGRIAHAIHSRNVVLLAIAASGCAWFTLFAANQVALLFLAYALGGISSGLFEPIGNSLVAQRSTAKNRGKAIGNFAAFGDMGRIAFLAAATLLAGWVGVSHACGILLATNVAALIVSQIYLPKPTPSDDPQAATSHVSLTTLLKITRFRFATLAGIFDSFSSASLYIFIPFLLIPKGITLADTPYFNGILFMGYASGRLVLGRLADKHGPAKVLIAAEVAMAALIVLLTLASGSVLIMALVFLLGIVTRGTSPIIRAMVADSMDNRVNFHDAFSAYSFASRSSTAACRPIYGLLGSLGGIAAVFYLAAAVSLLTIFPAARYNSPNNSEKQHPAA